MKDRLCCQISPSFNNLNELNNQYSWIPCGNNIRPCSNIITKKNIYNDNIKRFYQNENDFIFSEIFDFKNSIDKYGKLFVKPENVYKKYVFCQNMFPYEVPHNTHHYVMWYSYFDNTLNEEKINKDIYNQMKLLVKNDNFDFVWYENPKKTIEDIYHLQVFWIHKNL